MKKSNRLRLLVFIGVLTIFAGLVCWTQVISVILDDEETPEPIDMGYIKIGASSGIQTLTDSDLKHQYRIVADKGRLIRIEVKPAPDKFINLDVVRVDDYRLWEQPLDAYREPGEVQHILLNMVKGITYLIYVWGYGKTDYELRVTCEYIKLAPDNCS